jgi:aryl-phospho-beta-D-glucosidase BglC (GH1 family)
MRIIAAVLLLSCCLPAAPVPEERYARLARGVNLTRWFQYGSHQVIDESSRDLLKNAGFTAVRIAVAPQYLLPSWASPAEIAQNLDRLDRGIDLFLDVGIAVTLDFQADTEYLDYFFATPESAGELVETWRMLATRYANRNPELLFFEIMNEPDARFTQAAWDRVQLQALAVIHEVAPDHTALLAPAGWSGLESLLQMTPWPDDANVIYVLHYYSPTTFTHQGAAWVDQSGVAALRDIPWPAFLPVPEQTDPDAAERLVRYQAEDWDREHIEWDMNLAAQWAHKWNVKLIVNEFGAYKPFAEPASRARWLHDARTAIERNGFAWAVWDYAAGFDIVERNNIDPAVSAALGLTRWTEPDPVRTVRRPFNGPRTIQIGAQPEISSAPSFIVAADPLVLVASAPDNPVQLFRNDGHGILEPVPFDGPAPVSANAPVISGTGVFFPGNPGKMAFPSGNTLRVSAADLPPAVSAATVDKDLVLFSDHLQLLRNFHVVPGAFPPQTQQFGCGVFIRGNLHVFGPGAAKVFRYKRHGRFKESVREGKTLPSNSGEGQCTAITGPDAEIIVAWANGTIRILTKNGDETARRIGPLPQPKRSLRSIALSGATLVISRVGEPPLLYSRRNDGTFTPIEMKPANNLSVVAPVDLNRDGITDLVYAQGGNGPLIGRFGQR